ncbi:major facilitator superfamily domain-containing protein [Spinellus fusiger]|nr:major facilitator superfamily domain-containing protein [Spinellus fusiger]
MTEENKFQTSRYQYSVESSELDDISAHASGSNIPPPIVLTGTRFVIVFASLLLGLFMATLDQTILTTALPLISSEFNASDQLGWVGSAYLLTSSGFQPIYGVFADIIGHKTVYLVSLSIFLIGSILCGASKTMLMLIMSRGVQGIGAAGLITILLIIICDLVSPRERPKYLGGLGVAIGVATLAGPLLGGYFADRHIWRWAFYMNGFIGVVVIAVIVFFFKLPTHKASNESIMTQIKRADYAPVFLMMPGTICVLAALQFGGEKTSWSSPNVIALFTVGFALCAIFIACEIWIVPYPFIPRRFVMSRTNVAICMANFTGGATDYAIMFFVPLYFQLVHSDTATSSALELLPFFISAVVASFVTGLLISWTGRYRLILWTGCALTVVGTCLLQTTTIEMPRTIQYVYLGILGLGTGLCKQTFVVAGQVAADPKDLSLATSIGQFFRIFGGACGISIAETIFSFRTKAGLADLSQKTHQSFTLKNISLIKFLPAAAKRQVQIVSIDAINNIYRFTVACCIAAFLITLLVKHYDIWNDESKIQPTESSRENDTHSKVLEGSHV